MGACLLLTLPLEVVLGARVYRQPRRLLAAIGAPFLVFTLWDVWAIGRGHWWFSSTFTTVIRCRRSCATTSCAVAASTVAVRSSPAAVRAVYVNAGI